MSLSVGTVGEVIEVVNGLISIRPHIVLSVCSTRSIVICNAIVVDTEGGVGGGADGVGFEVELAGLYRSRSRDHFARQLNRRSVVGGDADVSPTGADSTPELFGEVGEVDVDWEVSEFIIDEGVVDGDGVVEGPVGGVPCCRRVRHRCCEVAASDNEKHPQPKLEAGSRCTVGA